MRNPKALNKAVSELDADSDGVAGDSRNPGQLTLFQIWSAWDLTLERTLSHLLRHPWATSLTRPKPFKTEETGHCGWLQKSPLFYRLLVLSGSKEGLDLVGPSSQKF